MKIVLFRRPYYCRARVSTFWRRNDCSLAIKREAVNQPSLSDPATCSISSPAISRATVTEHASTRATEQQHAKSLACRFRTTRWGVVLLSAQAATEGR